MRSIVVLAAVAVVAAAAIAATAEPRPLEERLVDIQVKELLPDLAPRLRDESIAVKQVMLAYADEPLLLLKAQAAYLRYPDMAREVLPIYGHEPEFRAVLAEYGEQVLLPVSYFLHNEVRTVAALHAASHRYRSAVHASRELFAERGTERPDAPVFQPLTEIDRGWYAINFIGAEGYDFLGQFVVDGRGNARWVQSERVMEGFAGLFTRGIRDFERAARSDEPLTGAHAGWAVLDVAIIVGVAKLATMGRGAATGTRAAASSTRTTTTGTRAGAVGARSFAGTAQAIGLPRIALYGAIAYVVIAHPSLINDALSALARWAGLPEWLVLGAGWALILFPLLLLAAMIGRLLLRPTFWLLQRLLGHSRTEKVRSMP